ncbi:GAF domain-containing protein [Candidatus Desantisbacteria bacterium]|nr:GAF domain-containing protein [Candidatus Desantisbacteria bacterium]
MSDNDVLNKEKLIHMVVHELKNPLTSIKGATDLILQKSLGDISPSIEQFMQIIHKGIIQLDSLINNLLDRSALLTANLSLNLGVHNLSNLINEAVSLVQGLADEYKIAIDTHIPDDLPEIIVDNQRIKQVLINLLTNGIKFTASHGKITITAKEDGDKIIVGVMDTGVGIASEYQDKIFNEFYQVPQIAPHERIRGSGLGLHIVQGLIESHEGKIWVESEVGKGSTFFFTIPKKGSYWLDMMISKRKDFGVGEKNLSDLVEVSVLQELQDKFAYCMDIPVIIVDVHGNILTKPSGLSSFCQVIRETETGGTMCHEFVKQIVDATAVNQVSKIFFCRSGLGHFAAPIISRNSYLGAIVIEGTQVFTAVSKEKIEELAQEIGVDVVDLSKTAEGIRIFPESKVYMAGELLISIANTIASLCTERYQLSSKVAELSTMSTIGKFITATLDMEKLLNSILYTVMNVLDANGGIISMVEAATGRLKTRVAYGTGGKMVIGTKRRMGESISAIVSAEKSPMLIRRDSDDTLSDILEKEGITSLMCIPLESKGELIGVFNLNRTGNHNFTTEDLEFFIAIGAQASIAIEESLLYQAVEQKVGQLDSFHKVGQAIISTLGIQQVLDLIVQSISKMMPTMYCSLQFLADTKEATITASSGLSKEYCSKEELVMDKGIVSHMVVTKEPVVIEDIKTDPRIKCKEYAINEGLVSLLSVPLMVKDEVLGIITVYSLETHRYAAEEIELLSTFATQAAIAIENARLFDVARNEIFNTAETLSEAIDERDGYGSEHTKNMVIYCVKTAKLLGLSADQIEGIRMGALLHDIGKVNISEEILLKKGKLTPEELELIRRHPLLGKGIIEKLNLPWNVKNIILQHHERIDGKGYPDGLIGGEIAVEALVIEVVEAYHAMRTKRPYREALSKEEAIEELKKCRGKEFDSEIVDSFLRVLQAEE